MNLYSDVLQLVVRNAAKIDVLADLKAVDASRISVGMKNSGTRWISRKILEDIGHPEAKTENFANLTFKDASTRLVEEGLDAAFFMAGAPVEAVSNAMQRCDCKLLSVPIARETAEGWGLSPGKEIPRLVYENQPEPVKTLEARALLVARRDLSEDVVEAVLHVVFDRLGGLAVANIRANEIELWQAFTELKKPLELHLGAQSFKGREEGRS